MATTGPGAVDERRWTPVRVAVAAAPWIVAACLVLLAALRPDAGVADTVGVPTAAPSVTPSPTPLAQAAPSPGDGTAPTPRASSLAPAPLLDPAARLAVLTTAHRHVLDGPPRRWPLSLEIVAVDTYATTAIATVHGLVLERVGDDWRGPVTVGLAVPVSLDPPAVLGSAWPAPAPDPVERVPSTTPLEDVDPTVTAPLVAAGWRVDAVHAVAATADGLLVLDLTGTAPGDDAPSDHRVWLLDDPGGPRLLPVPTPSPTPPEDRP